jgi:hypothetical protein
MLTTPFYLTGCSKLTFASGEMIRAGHAPSITRMTRGEDPGTSDDSCMGHAIVQPEAESGGPLETGESNLKRQLIRS